MCPDAAVYSQDMKKAVQDYTEEELRVEFAKLFVGPFELLAPPYGSVYLDEGGRVMGDSTMEVIDAYEKEGLSRSDNFKDLPDHIAVEMEFMSYLIYTERKALDRLDSDTTKEYADKQEDFLNAFVRPWINPFCKKIKEGTENSFYRALAGCLSTFI